MRRRGRGHRVFKTSTGFVQVHFLGPGRAMLSTSGEDGWSAGRLSRPVRRDTAAIARGLRRLAVSPDEADAIAERVAADWPLDTKPIGRAVANGVVTLAFALVGVVATGRALARALRRAAPTL